MPRVICVLQNASDEINGIKFHQLEHGGVISDEISEELAARFATIPGYSLDEEEREPEPAKQPEPAAPEPPKLTKAQQKALEKQQAAATKAAQEEAEKGAGNLVKAVTDVAAHQIEKAKEEAGDNGGSQGNDEVF